jgi:hypothetical protein
MTYVLITLTPAQGLKDYQAVNDELGPEPPAGNLVSLAGETADGALVTADIWESSVAADRFAAEQLFPVFQRLGIAPGSDSSAWAVEGTEVEAPKPPAVG